MHNIKFMYTILSEKKKKLKLFIVFKLEVRIANM